MVTPLSMTVTLPVDPRYVSKARRLLRVFAAGSWIPLDDLALLISEVVTNAMEHAGLGPEDRLSIEAELVDDQSIRVRVHDRGPGIPREYWADRPSRGAGLRVLDKVASAWGSEPGLVWFEL